MRQEWKIRPMERTRQSRFAAVWAACLVLSLPNSTTAVTVHSYAGWATTSDRQGIKGYIQQVDPGTIAAGEAVLSWVGLCAFVCTAHAYADGGSGLQWVQLGMYQGDFACCASSASVHIYYENMSPCGDYYSGDVGAPGPNPFFFQVHYDEEGVKSFHCANGAQYNGYQFNYKKGSGSSTAFYSGVMQPNDGRADANTELLNTPAEDISKFGCSSSSCSNQDFGIHLHGPNSWFLWDTGTAARSIGPDNPPYRNTFNSYWSFKTCKVAC